MTKTIFYCNECDNGFIPAEEQLEERQLDDMCKVFCSSACQLIYESKKYD